MRYFTIKRIGELLPGCGMSHECVYTLCRSKKLYSIVYNGQIMIPEESLIFYMKYNLVLTEILAKNEGGADLMRDRNEIMEHMRNMPDLCDETYTKKQVANIFGVDIKRINKELRAKSFKNIFNPWQEITIFSILFYLKHNPDAKSRLEDRHTTLLANGDYLESTVRHILMLSMYYETNGYII